MKICRPILPIRFDRMYERDRQTDTDTHRMTANAALDMLASRGKTGSEYRPYQMTFSRDQPWSSLSAACLCVISVCPLLLTCIYVDNATTIYCILTDNNFIIRQLFKNGY